MRSPMTFPGLVGCAALTGIALLQTAPARSETLIATLSTDKIAITSNFTGADLTLFGAIERDGGTIARAGEYDVVVTVRGPRGSVVVREKKQLGPLWLNLSQRKYIVVPAFISVLSSHPLTSISSPEVRAKLRLGIDNLVTPQGDKTKTYDSEEPDFRAALLRLRREQKLFNENGSAVSFFGNNLFRTSIQVPGAAPLGNYDVDLVLLSDGVPLAKTATAFTVIKTGVEQTITAAARNEGLGYGATTAGLALMLGWLATIIFRRD